VQISRYGKTQVGAKYHGYPDQLAKCKRRIDQNCVLHIVYSLLEIWTVEARPEEVIVAANILTRPLEYFEKANAYGDKAEPRYVLNLGEPYTAKQVDERQRALREEIERTDLGGMREQIIQILNAAAFYAKLLLSNPDQSTKIMLAFHGKLHPELVKNGSKIACSLFTGVTLPRMDQRTYLDSIIDLMLFYYDMAIQKNQPFSEGTFVLQDLGNRIYDFLLNYVKMVNPDALTATPSFENPTIQLANPRKSTHFRARN